MGFERTQVVDLGLLPWPQHVVLAGGTLDLSGAGLEVQYTTGAWLWKFEGIRRSGQGTPYYAATGGVEYTLVVDNGITA